MAGRSGGFCDPHYESNPVKSPQRRRPFKYVPIVRFVRFTVQVRLSTVKFPTLGMQKWIKRHPSMRLNIEDALCLICFVTFQNNPTLHQSVQT